MQLYKVTYIVGSKTKSVEVWAAGPVQASDKVEKAKGYTVASAERVK